jgi:uncharacterized protein YqgQ
MKYLLLFILALPVCLYSQTSHYDSLYQKGLISKEDYQLLTKPTPADSAAMKVAQYERLYKAGQISKEDYDRLRTPILVKRDKEMKVNPDMLMRRGKAQIGFGAALLGGSGLFFTISGISGSKGNIGGEIGTAVVGSLMFCTGLPLLIHGLVLRHRAKNLMVN